MNTSRVSFQPRGMQSPLPQTTHRLKACQTVSPRLRDSIFHRALLLTELALLCLVWSSGECLHAAPPEVPPPRAPWIASVPEKGAWEAIVRHPQPPPPKEGVPPRLEVPKPVRIASQTWNAVKVDTVTLSDSRTTTLIYFGGMVLVEGERSGGGRVPVLVHQQRGTDYDTLRSGGWLAMDWLEERYYVGPEEYPRTLTSTDGQPDLCYRFRKPAGKDPTAPDWMPECVAWVRVSDLRPVAAKVGSSLIEFAHLPPPIAPPPMSQEQAAKLMDLKDQSMEFEKLNERNKRLRARQ